MPGKLNEEGTLLQAAHSLLTAFGAIEGAERARELVVPELAAFVAQVHLDRAPNVDGQLRGLELAAAVSIYRTVLPSRPDLVPRGVRAYLAQAPADEAAIAAALTDHGMVLVSVVERTGSVALASAAVATLGAGLDEMPDDDPRKPYLLSNLGSMLQDPFGTSPSSLDIAVEVISEAIELLPENDENRLPITKNLTRALMARFTRSGDIADIDAAIETWEETAALVGSSDGAAALGFLAESFGYRYAHSASAHDLDAAIKAGQAALAAVTAGTLATPQVSMLARLAGQLHIRHDQTGNQEDLESAIAAMRRVVAGGGAGQPDYGSYLAGLASMLRSRYDTLGEGSDLEQAVRLSQLAVTAVPVGDPERPSVLAEAARVLTGLFERTGLVGDLDAAVAAAREALAALPATDPAYVRILSNLGGTLRTGFERTGDTALLDEAIEAGRAAVAATPADHPNRGARLLNLGSSLGRRFELTGAVADLQAGVDATQEAVTVMPVGRPGRIMAVSNLGFWLRKLFERTGDPGTLYAAVENGRLAVDTSLPTDPLRPMYLNNLAGTLMLRYQRGDHPADLDEGIEASRGAVRGTPPGHPRRARYLSVLGGLLSFKHEVSGTRADLDAAIAAAREAVDEAPQGDPERAVYLNNLAHSLMAAYDRDGAPEAAAAARDALRAASGTVLAAASLRAQTGASWGFAAAACGDWPDAVQAYTLAVEQLNLASWHGLDQADRLHRISQLTGLPGNAAAAALNAGQPEYALVLLEQARGILLAQALRARADRDAVRAADPDLAAELDMVRGELDQADGGPEAVPTSDSPLSTMTSASLIAQQTMQRHLELAAKWDELVATVRRLPGLASFMAQPSYADLQRAGDDGPVVIINISRYRCDALILAAGGLRVVPLPGLSQQNAAERVITLLDALAATGSAGPATAGEVLGQTLEWLRQEVITPVFAALAVPGTGPDTTATRLWWSPVGLAAFLPFHAAGVPSQVACSYTPSLTTLIDARSRRQSPPGPMLAVALPSTPRLSDLPLAEAELAMVSSCVPVVDSLLGPDATREHLLTRLAGHSLLHFAGHGQQDPFNQQSAAMFCHDYLEHGPVTAADIAGLHLQGAELAFLSACHTARGSAQLSDESVHLAGALQLAGFRHVIAAQWMVSDSLAPWIARQVYLGLVDESGEIAPSRAPWALQAAINAVRDRGRPPLLWASYVHIGP